MRSVANLSFGVGMLLLGILPANNAHAQFGPYYSRGYAWDAWPAMVAEKRYDTTRQLAGSYKRQSEALAAQQRRAGEQRIDRTLLAQANAQSAAARQSAQGYRDWWLQTQDRQFAQDRARRASMSAAGGMPPPMLPPAGAPMLASTSQPASALSISPQARTDLIQWPPVLQDSRFDEARAVIEGPFRRAKQDGTAITVDDYRTIIATCEQMQKTLTSMASDLRGDVLLSGNDFLDLLIRQSRERIAARQQTPPKTQPDAPPGTQ